MKPKEPTIYKLLLRPAPGWRAEPIRRLRGALKCLGRSFGLICTGVEEVNQATEAHDATDDGREVGGDENERPGLRRSHDRGCG